MKYDDASHLSYELSHKELPAELEEGSWLVEGRLASSEGCAGSSASV